MNTLSVSLRYRPLRIAYCIAPGDLEAFRAAVRMAYVQWGGRFNPIVPVGDEAAAAALLKVFRADAVLALSDNEAVREFVAKQTHLPWPLFSDGVFTDDRQIECEVVDLHHPVSRVYEEMLRDPLDQAVTYTLHEWDQADPLSDVFLATYGGAPSTEVAGLDYVAMVRANLLTQRAVIPINGEVPPQALGATSFASLNRTWVRQHYSVQNAHDDPGFYVGHADNIDDLVHFWNLRACDVQVMFYDERFPERYPQLLWTWGNDCRRLQRNGFNHGRVTLWHRPELPIGNPAQFGVDLAFSHCDAALWNGHNIRVPEMFFGESSSLGSIDASAGSTSVTFAIADLPLVKQPSLDRQAYVLSLDPGIGLFRNEKATFHLPFLPALNEFYGRACHFEWNRARAEPTSIGVVLRGYDRDCTIRAIDVSQLIIEILKSAGINAEPSAAGRVVLTLIRQMGGLDNCRAFKIDGVRHLIERHPPDKSFTRNTAKQMISQGEVRRLGEYRSLYIEKRPTRSPLTDDGVFKHLLERGVFRAGLEFTCPNCTLSYWKSLDEAQSQTECEYCGHRFSVVSQLPTTGWSFRRSGLFGRNDHQGGGIAVALTLQQLVKVSGFDEALFTAGLNLTGDAIPACETDFVVVSQRARDHRLQVVIGEVKTRNRISADDVRNLTAVADAFPSDIFDVFIAFARLTEFSNEEIELIRPLNEGHRLRVIMLTDRELEPYFVYERTHQEFDINRTAVSFADMATVTEQVFFRELRRAQG